MRSLHLRTLELLAARDDSLQKISDAVGVNYFWLRSFRYGKITHPSVNRVQALYEYLTGKPLEL